MNFDYNYAAELDKNDPLASFRNEFHIPKRIDGTDTIYFCGNSLGLMPLKAEEYVQQELDDWKKHGVEGHVHARNPWVSYHELLTKPMADIVGGLTHEVVVMNSLTVNLHLLMVSFYRPTQNRYKILIDHSPFPSDRYAVESQVKFHGFDPDNAIIELVPETDSEYVSPTHISDILERKGHQIALVMIGGVNYYTGQAYNIREITRAAHDKGCMVGFDLAHAAGNLKLALHDDGPDFAAWCSYKYLNSGPGGLSGIFIHDRHKNDFTLPRFTGWWGHNKEARFKMGKVFTPMEGAEGWQLSNPPILPMATMRASLEIFTLAGMTALREKSLKLTNYLESLIKVKVPDKVKLITPSVPEERGCQLSLQVSDKVLFHALTEQGIVADWREPDVIRIAPVPLYNTFCDAWKFVDILNKCSL